MGVVGASAAKKTYSLVPCHHLFVSHSFSGRGLYRLPLNFIYIGIVLDEYVSESFPICICVLS